LTQTLKALTSSIDSLRNTNKTKTAQVAAQEKQKQVTSDLNPCLEFNGGVLVAWLLVVLRDLSKIVPCQQVKVTLWELGFCNSF